MDAYRNCSDYEHSFFLLKYMHGPVYICYGPFMLSVVVPTFGGAPLDFCIQKHEGMESFPSICEHTQVLEVAMLLVVDRAVSLYLGGSRASVMEILW